MDPFTQYLTKDLSIMQLNEQNYKFCGLVLAPYAFLEVQETSIIFLCASLIDMIVALSPNPNMGFSIALD